VAGSLIAGTAVLGLLAAAAWRRGRGQIVSPDGRNASVAMR
jgi:hypothetical protein